MSKNVDLCRKLSKIIENCRIKRMQYQYRINEVKLKIGESKEVIPYRIEKKLNLKPGTITKWELRRESIDARDKGNIRLVYTVDFLSDREIRSKLVTVVKDEEAPFEPLTLRGNQGAETGARSGEEAGARSDEKGARSDAKSAAEKSAKKSAKSDEVAAAESEARQLRGRPVIIGAGPCGIFAALELAKYGYRPILFERGAEMSDRVKAVDDFRALRVLDPEANMLFGEGGAGTFSDGKLTSGIKDGNVRQVLRTFADAGAGEDIMYLHRPHIGTDVLRTVIVNLRNKIIELGGEVHFNTKMTGMLIENGELSGIQIENTRNGAQATIDTDALILAIGHSARDTFSLIKELGFDMEQKAFSIGVRMEHPQEIIDRAQYGDEDRLPPADYKLSYKASNGRGVYSFCMCPGGEVVVCSTKDGELCVNGMSNRKRDSGTANSGILCDVRTSDFGSDDVLAGVEFQRKWEKIAFELGGGDFTPPSTSMENFLEGNKSADAVIRSLPSWAYEAIREAVPSFARKIKGYDMPSAVVTAVETRSSSPVRIRRGDDGQSNIKGVYPAGEGAGYAGGITSAACDGIKTARRIMSSFLPASEGENPLEGGNSLGGEPSGQNGSSDSADLTEGETLGQLESSKSSDSAEPIKSTLCYIEQDGKYLMLYRNKKKHDPNAGKWIGVGGKFKPGESALDCIKREVREETGITDIGFIYRGLVHFRADRWADEEMYVFTAEPGSLPECIECDEGELKWISKDKILTLPLWEGDRFFLQKLLSREAGAEPFEMTLQYEGENLVSCETR